MKYVVYRTFIRTAEQGAGDFTINNVERVANALRISEQDLPRLSGWPLRRKV